MFGFSLQKLVFTGLAIAAVIYGFRWFAAWQERQQQVKRRGAGPKPRSASTQQAASSSADDTETMIECKVCNTYVAASGTRSCGRDNCPYPG